MVLPILTAIILAIGALVIFARWSSARARAAAEAAKGGVVGQWTVYYDVSGKRIGLKASFGEEHLLRFLVFRLHDLFDYNQGMAGEQARIAEAVRAAAHGAPETSWTLLFPPPREDCYHAGEAPDGTLFKFFEGALYEGAVDRPRFIGGDAREKQQGLEGECVALAAHLANTRPAEVAAAVEALVSRQLAEGTARPGPRFWERANAALSAASPRSAA